MQYHCNRRPARQPVKSDWVKKTGLIGAPDRSIVAPTTLSANGRYLRKAVVVKTGKVIGHRGFLCRTPIPQRNSMHLSNESLIAIIIVGIVAGWLAGNIVSGGGYGLVGDLIVGVIGAFIGDRLVPRFGIHLGTGIVVLIVNATLGAIVLLIILRLISGAGGRGWRSRFGGRW
jgi:uncharacterized membrane protein YeaQ/YmgE (transglycosylase-associated protein family)